MTSRSIRVLEPAEVETLVGWAAAEGWNPGLGDAAAFRAADPQGFLGAFVDGRMAAGISAIAYGAGYGFIGLYICRPEMRGMGHGKAVWDAGMARLAGRVVGLDGVDAQLDNYRSRGFVPAYRTVRFGGRLAAGKAEAGKATAIVDGAGETHRAEIVALDRMAFPEPRDAFLARWLAPPHVVRVATSGDRVTGYGVMRACRVGWKIGGLVAQDEAAAFAIVRSLAAAAPDADIFLDVPAPRRAFAASLASAGLTPGFETTRMYLGGEQPLADGLFAATTLELG